MGVARGGRLAFAGRPEGRALQQVGFRYASLSLRSLVPAACCIASRYL
jgi:hypothetical protein